MTVATEKQDEIALRLMAEYADKIAPDKMAREKAAANVLGDLLALNGAYGFQVSRDKNDRNSIFVILQHQQVRVTVMRGEKFRIAPDTMSEARDVTGLEFNRVSGEWVSTSDDDRYEPKYGEPRTRKRTAVAEVITQVLKMMAADR